MLQGADEYAVDTYRHPRGWSIVPVWAGTMYRIEFVLNTGYLMSALNGRSRTTLGALGFIRSVDARLYVLENLTLAGRPFPMLQCMQAWGLSY